MTRAFTRSVRSALATSAVALLLAAGVAHSTANRYVEQPEFLQPTAAQEMFADAEFGVDPMVTGPVSASFEQTQTALGCDKAVWPNIPPACYPDR